MVKIIELATGKEHIFTKTTEAAKFLGMATSSLYNKYKAQSDSRGYRITLLEMSENKGRRRTNDFKHFKSDKFKVDFYNKTAIISWKRKVDDDFDEVLSYKRQNKAISDTLRQNTIFDTNFIFLQEISPKSYTQLPPEEEILELYVHFKNDIDIKEKKDAVKHLLPYLLNHQQ